MTSSDRWANTVENDLRKLNQGPLLAVSAFAGYGTVNRTSLPQPLKRTSPINRTRNEHLVKHRKHLKICVARRSPTPKHGQCGEATSKFTIYLK